MFDYVWWVRADLLTDNVLNSHAFVNIDVVFNQKNFERVLHRVDAFLREKVSIDPCCQAIVIAICGKVGKLVL